MARVITFSRTFLKQHPKAGQPTYFVEKFIKSLYSNGITIPYYSTFSLSFLQSLSNESFNPKHHTIRKGKRWKAGDYMSPRVWGNDVNPKSGKSGPYHSKQITLCNDVLITNVYDIKIDNTGLFSDVKINGQSVTSELIELIALNDGLTVEQFYYWFNVSTFDGQIICWKKDLYNELLK